MFDDIGRISVPAAVRYSPPSKPVLATRITAPVELHRFGGLKGLRKHGHFKEVRTVDPFSGGTMLHFPTTLHADNWLQSCFGRSLKYTVPTEPLQALDNGRLVTSRCSLILFTPRLHLADFVVRQLDPKSKQRWERFQIVAKAHGLVPVLRTADEIRVNPLRLLNLDRMRQQLVQTLSDMPLLPAATAAVERLLRERGTTTLAQLCEHMARKRYTRSLTESAVIVLYRHQALQLDISEAPYGDSTRVELL